MNIFLSEKSKTQVKFRASEPRSLKVSIEKKKFGIKKYKQKNYIQKREQIANITTRNNFLKMNKSGDIDEGRNRNVQRKGNHENEVKPCQEQNGKMAS